MSTAEDTPLAIQLVAADVDSAQTALQYSIRSAPQHGTLVQVSEYSGLRQPG